VLVTIQMDIQDGKGFEEATKFLRRKIVMR
jgi:hypothetical protein